MEEERRLLDSLGLAFAQERTRKTLAAYIHGLRVADGPRTLTKLAECVADGDTERRNYAESFNYHLSDARRRGARWWVGPMMRALAERGMRRLDESRRRGYLLVAMQAPRLGSRKIREEDLENRTVQIVAVLLAVGHGPTGEVEALPMGWRLAFDAGVWGDAEFERHHVPESLRELEHVSAPADAMLEAVREWAVPQLPVIATSPFAERRFRWINVNRSYVVEWKSPHPAARNSVPSDAPPDMRSAETIEQDIQLRLGQWWTSFRVRASTRTSLGWVRVIDVTSGQGQVESVLQMPGGTSWCAHLPGERKIEAAAELIQLRVRAANIYRNDLRAIGLDDYRGRTFSGWHAHRALVAAAHLLNRETAWGDA